MQTDILVIGAGLAGLAIADGLAASGRDFILVEARDRVGGRISTQNCEAGYFDMGPTWYWPGQPRMAALVSRLGLATFEQHHIGRPVFEDALGQVERGRGFASMQGTLRVCGGMAAVTDALSDALPDGFLHLKTPVTTLERTPACVMAGVANGDNITAQRVVIALPPRLAAERITFSPSLPLQAMDAMRRIPTWMAGQAKAVALYDTAFWRDERLSGNAMSQRGPMVEIHDASPANGGPFALFGFIGVPPRSRSDETVLRRELLAQLERLFGPNAAAPHALLIKDWAHDPFTATHMDQAPMHAHPRYALPQAMTGLWDNCLVFGGTEVAPQFGGYLEGALEAAENTLADLNEYRLEKL